MARTTINSGSAEELATLRGVGPVLAERIVAERDERGPFRSPADLARVKGISPSLAASLSGTIDWRLPLGQVFSPSTRVWLTRVTSPLILCVILVLVFAFQPLLQMAFLFDLWHVSGSRLGLWMLVSAYTTLTAVGLNVFVGFVNALVRLPYYALVDRTTMVLAITGSALFFGLYGLFFFPCGSWTAPLENPLDLVLILLSFFAFSSQGLTLFEHRLPRAFVERFRSFASSLILPGAVIHVLFLLLTGPRMSPWFLVPSTLLGGIYLWAGVMVARHKLPSRSVRDRHSHEDKALVAKLDGTFPSVEDQKRLKNVLDRRYRRRTWVKGFFLVAAALFVLRVGLETLLQKMFEGLFRQLLWLVGLG